ncbi:MAG: helix-turn-helix transcriptional regulator [Alphaproteobacteria bacterium]|nr:helix-turn-helix transcriptional regulator [Alphaproteobacteria bacterium]
MYEPIPHACAAKSDGLIRDIGPARQGLCAMETRLAVGDHTAPQTDVHRFNIQLSGKQSFRAFELDRMLRSAPITATAGTISFIPAGSHLRSVTEGDDLHAFRLLIPREMMSDTIARSGSDKVDRGTALAGYIGTPTDRIHRLARLIYDEFRAPGKGHEVIMESLIQALCAELVRDICGTAPAAGTRAPLSATDREEILNLMEAAIDGGLTINCIAKQLGLKPYHFSRRFRAQFGETPKKHLDRRRLDRACRLLTETDAPIVEIAYDCGFSSQAHLTTFLSQHLGTTPARYRAARRAEH